LHVDVDVHLRLKRLPCPASYSRGECRRVLQPNRLEAGGLVEAEHNQTAAWKVGERAHRLSDRIGQTTGSRLDLDARHLAASRPHLCHQPIKLHEDKLAAQTGP